MKKMYWLLALVLVIAVALPSANISMLRVSSGSAAYAQDGQTEITFWHFWGSPVRRTAVRRVVAICEAQMDGIKVNEVFKPWGEIWTANIAAVAAGSGMPDVIVEDRPQLPRIAADGIEQSLQPFIDRDNFDTSVFWPFTWDQTLYEGESYGVPFETDVRVLFYNKTILNEAGYDSPPQSWDDLWAYADALDQWDENGNLKRMAFFPLYGNVGLDLWAMTDGHVWVQDGKPVIDDPVVLETVQWLKKWVDRYGGWEKVQEFLAQYGAPPNDAFMSGAVLMKVDVAGYHSQLSFYRPKATLADGTQVNMDWSAGLIPYKVEPATWSGGFALSIPVGAEHPEEAWQFIKCASGYDANISWARDTYAIPTYKEAAYDPVLMADSIWQFFVQSMEYGKLIPYVPAYSNWYNDTLNTMQEDVWYGNLSPEDMLKDAQDTVDAEF
jgi:multiple sugar transport system substrate-binding protein